MTVIILGNTDLDAEGIEEALKERARIAKVKSLQDRLEATIAAIGTPRGTVEPATHGPKGRHHDVTGIYQRKGRRR